MFLLAGYGCSASEAHDEEQLSQRKSERGSEKANAADAAMATGTEPEAAAAGRAADDKCRDNACVAAVVKCSKAEDCAGRGPEYNGGRCENSVCLPNRRWRCEPPPGAAASDTRELTLPVIDALQLSPLPNVSVAACDELDEDCSQPVAVATSDKDGMARFSVPASFSGYLQQTEHSDYTPALYFAARPEDGVFRNFPLIASSVFAGLNLALGAQVNRERGHLMLIIEDCQGLDLGGISFTSPQADMQTTQFYIRDQIPTTSADETPPEGDGGYANMPPGMVEITAFDKKSGLVLNTVRALIRAGASTTVYMRPALRGSNVTQPAASNAR